jgi:GDPmannose 4,6-dehydratase
LKALIFGINSQDGHYLREACMAKDIEVLGVSRSAGHWISGDVSDRPFVEKIVSQQTPDFIFHLAARSTTSHDAIFENHETISTGTLNILEAVRRFSPNAKVFITGSGVQFRNEGLPISESDPFEARSPYAFSRSQSVFAARYFRQLGISAYVGYLFHHESPLRKQNHLSKYIVDKAKQIAAANREPLVIRNSSVRKEWAYAKDIAEGILHLVSQNTVYEATIGSGKAFSVLDWVKLCFEEIGLDYKDHLAEQPEGFQAEYELLVSDPTTMKSLGWQTTTGIEELAKIMMRS